MSSTPTDSSTEPSSGPRAPLPVRLLPPIVAIALILLALWVVSGESLNLPQIGVPSSAPRVGARAPDFSLKTADGTTIKLSDLRGKRVVLNFWATWCPPCRAEMPDLNRVASDYRSQGVVVLGVDQLESPDKVAGFFSETGIGSSPAITPIFDADGAVAESYHVTALPSTFVVDADGVIRNVQLGALAEGTLRAQLERIK